MINLNNIYFVLGVLTHLLKQPVSDAFLARVVIYCSRDI